MLQHDYFFKIHATFNPSILFIYQRILVIKNEKKKALNPSPKKEGFFVCSWQTKKKPQDVCLGAF
jgi:lipocalin